MAPTIPKIPQLRSIHLHLFTRASNPNKPPLTSIFALVMYRAQTLARSSSKALARSLSSRSADRSSAAVTKLSVIKRQQQILVIPTTYANIRDSPSPGAVVGITLGAVFGFLLALLVLLLIFRTVYGQTEVVEEEVVTRRSHRSRSKSIKKHSPTASSLSDPPPIPVPEPEPEPEPEPVVLESRRSSRQSRRESRISRRTSRMSRRSPEQVIVEEEMSSVHEAPPPEEVVVIEEHSDVHTAEPEVVVEEEEEDIVEVIEEHSPEPPSRRKSSARRSGTFRTVDPAEYGGGDAPSRRISRQSRGS